MKRDYVSNHTRESMLNSYKNVLNSLAKRQKEVYDSLQDFSDGCTVWELVVYLKDRGIIPRADRNLVHPRLNELTEQGLAEVVGKTNCTITQKEVSKYKAINSNNFDVIKVKEKKPKTFKRMTKSELIELIEKLQAEITLLKSL